MNVLARARGLHPVRCLLSNGVQERIRPVSSVSRFVHTVLIQQATFAPLKRWLLTNQPEKSSWFPARGSHRPASHILTSCVGGGEHRPSPPSLLPVIASEAWQSPPLEKGD